MYTAFKGQGRDTCNPYDRGRGRFVPDLINWHKEGKGIYVSNDGLQKVTKTRSGDGWVPSVRRDWDSPWVKDEYTYSALHAAQDACRRLLTTSGYLNPKKLKPDKPPRSAQSAKDRPVQVVTYEVRKTQTGSEKYYPVINSIPYYYVKFETRQEALTQAKKMAEIYKKGLAQLGYKSKIVQKSANSSKDNIITYGYRPGYYKNQAGYYYPVLNDHTPSSSKAYKTPKGALDYAKKLAQQQKKIYPGATIREVGLQLEKNYWPDDTMGHRKAALKGWKVRTYMGTRKVGKAGKGNPKAAASKPAPSSVSPLSLKNAIKIYDDVLSIEARKGKDSLWPKMEFKHDFDKSKGKAAIYGLEDGSLLIKGSKPLWEKFDY